MPSIEDEALRIIQSRPEGVLQSELWKLLNIDSRKCSRLVKKLDDAGLIERIEYRDEGIKTYQLKVKQQEADPSLLMAGEELIPCVACELDCVVEQCPLILDWMYELAISEVNE
ncbi:winged helix DNA-binding protein [Methanofollis fontis]|uniref:MarR family transcriptional regulator n=1 Tax=Methanofollis fontis TaxID=2052832 RepID=A0A483CNQ1_9EURY|nr:winged helix DNA-binding protein [Methanofollis fontis]TAJ44682.1 MarR family transcriptional regulator [Methanofollis fontis]